VSDSSSAVIFGAKVTVRNTLTNQSRIVMSDDQGFFRADLLADASAKRAAEQLAADLGFDPLDVGPLSNSKYLEMLAGFWGTLAFGQKLGLEIGFRLLRR